MYYHNVNSKLILHRDEGCRVGSGGFGDLLLVSGELSPLKQSPVWVEPPRFPDP